MMLVDEIRAAVGVGPGFYRLVVQGDVPGAYFKIVDTRPRSIVKKAVAALAERDALNARLVAERDALAADNALLMAEFADRVAERDQSRAANERLRDELAGYKREHNRHTYAPQALSDVEDLLTKAGYIDEDDDEDDIGVVTRALEDALRDLKLCQEALARISAALTATGRDADAGGIADAVEEALLDLSARWRGRDEALERIREAMDMAPSSPADIANTAVQMITLYRWRAARAVDVLPDAPATGGDCGGAA